MNKIFILIVVSLFCVTTVYSRHTVNCDRCGQFTIPECSASMPMGINYSDGVVALDYQGEKLVIEVLRGEYVIIFNEFMTKTKVKK